MVIWVVEYKVIVDVCSYVGVVPEVSQLRRGGLRSLRPCSTYCRIHTLVEGVC